MSIEVVILPVADPDRSLRFYRDQVGFALDVDYAPAPGFRVIQLTPEGSHASIQFGVGLTDAPAGSVRGLYLVVPDIEACRAELIGRGVTVGEIRHKDTDGGWRGGFLPGTDPDRGDYASFADFRDPDGNAWVLQERNHQRGGGGVVAARKTSPDRVGAFSDGVFAVLITILVLELKPPKSYTFNALLPEWPTGLSYVVSYVFIAIVWVNHHHLFGYAQVATPRLVWSNFAHLFSVSLIPITTEWIADSRLAAAPVVLYASVFVLVNITYLALCQEVVDRPAHEDLTQRVRRLLRMRSFITIGVFAAAAVVALWWPAVGMVLICVCLAGYLRPDVPNVKKVEP